MELKLVKNTSTRLPPEDIDDLEFLWLRYESSIGIVSQHEALVACLINGKTEKQSMHEGPVWQDPYTSGMLKSVARSRSVRGTLLEMIERGHSKSVTVLYKVYGDTKRHPPFGVFGDLSNLVELTRPAEIQANKHKTTPRIAIENRMREADSGAFAKSLLVSAERILALASKHYLEAKDAVYGS